jgi:hypothetical protein
LEKEPAGHGHCAPAVVPPGQKKPRGQASGAEAAGGQKARGGQGLHAARPGTSAYAPPAQGVGDAEPSGHDAPTLQSTLAVDEPAPHTKPAGHAALGAARPAAVHRKPGVQGWHAASVVAPLALLKVPGGQGVGAAEPEGQKLPAPQSCPVTPSLGMGVVAPP